MIFPDHALSERGIVPTLVPDVVRSAYLRLTSTLSPVPLAILASLIAATCIAWALTLYQATTMTGPLDAVMGGGMAHDSMEGMAMEGMSAADWSFTGLGIFLAFWTVMMAAMMLPAAMPMIVIFASAQDGVIGKSQSRHGSSSPAIYSSGRRRACWSMSLSRPGANWRAIARGSTVVSGGRLRLQSRWRSPGSISSRRSNVFACAIAGRPLASWHSIGAMGGQARSIWGRGTASTASAAAGRCSLCWLLQG